MPVKTLKKNNPSKGKSFKKGVKNFFGRRGKKLYNIRIKEVKEGDTCGYNIEKKRNKYCKKGLVCDDNLSVCVKSNLKKGENKLSNSSIRGSRSRVVYPSGEIKILKKSQTSKNRKGNSTTVKGETPKRESTQRSTQRSTQKSQRIKNAKNANNFNPKFKINSKFASDVRKLEIPSFKKSKKSTNSNKLQSREKSTNYENILSQSKEYVNEPSKSKEYVNEPSKSKGYVNEPSNIYENNTINRYENMPNVNVSKNSVDCGYYENNNIMVYLKNLFKNEDDMNKLASIYCNKFYNKGIENIEDLQKVYIKTLLINTNNSKYSDKQLKHLQNIGKNNIDKNIIVKLFDFIEADDPKYEVLDKFGKYLLRKKISSKGQLKKHIDNLDINKINEDKIINKYLTIIKLRKIDFFKN